MAKITVAGNAVVITSGVKLEDIKLVAKYRPDALTLKDEETKEEIFVVGVTGEKSSGTINQYGASVSGSTNNADGFATITVLVENVKGDIKEFVADTIGGAFTKFNAVEEKLPAVVEEIKADRAAVINAITTD